jgi:cobalt/nickel transport system permease protein
MGAGHTHPLYVHEHSPIHHLAPEAKIVGAFGLVASAAITPREAVWAFAAYVIGLFLLVKLSRVRFRFVAARLLALTPFFLFAFFIPFIASGESISVAGMTLSVEGLWGAWNILIKALIGGTVSIVLTATTEIPEIIRGLGVLRVPAVLVSIASFMVRYLELVADELRRMRVAMTARGFDPRWLHQARPIAASAGALFVRSYERGERVHNAMLARGFSGEMPSSTHTGATSDEWGRTAIAVVLFVTLAVLALVLT